MIRKAVSGAVELKEGPAGEGLVQAVFCTFDVPDRDGDVVLKSAFTDGQKIKMMWAHDDSRWIGDGTITTTAKEAVFTGEFWMDTTAGLEAFKAVRRATAKELAEWSWAFNVPAGASKYGKFGNENVRYLGIKPLEVFEVSPVATGAGVDTRTTAIKSRAGLKAIAEMSAEERRSEIQEAINEQIGGGPLSPSSSYAYVIATYDDRVIVCDEDMDYWQIPYTLDAAGEAQLGDPVEVQQIWIPVTGGEPAADLGFMSARAGGQKVGRAIARTRREQIAASISALREQADSLEKLLADADPAAGDGKSKQASRIRIARMRAELGEATARGGYAGIAN